MFELYRKVRSSKRPRWQSLEELTEEDRVIKKTMFAVTSTAAEVSRALLVHVECDVDTHHETPLQRSK